jgi:hypothetical protein
MSHLYHTRTRASASRTIERQYDDGRESSSAHPAMRVVDHRPLMAASTVPPRDASIQEHGVEREQKTRASAP